MKTYPQLEFQFRQNSFDEKPLFDHDCMNCKFRGFLTFEGKEHDIYTCNHSVIARESSDGPDYHSTDTRDYSLSPAYDIQNQNLVWGVMHATIFALLETRIIKSKLEIVNEI